MVQALTVQVPWVRGRTVQAHTAELSTAQPSVRTRFRHCYFRVWRFRPARASRPAAQEGRKSNDRQTNRADAVGA